MSALTPPKKVSAAELLDGKTFRSTLMEVINYLRRLRNEVNEVLRATKDILQVHFLIRQFEDRLAEQGCRLSWICHFLTHQLLTTGEVSVFEAAELEKVLEILMSCTKIG